MYVSRHTSSVSPSRSLCAHELTTLKLVIAPQWRTQATEDTFRAHHHETRRTKFL